LEDIVVPDNNCVWKVKCKTDTLIKKDKEYLVSDNLKHIAKDDYYLLMPTPVPSKKDTDAGFLAKRIFLSRDYGLL
jgi:hypothetical protein